MKRKDFKLYADECIGQDLVDHLREVHNLNIKMIEKRLLGKSDERILNRANE